MFWTLTLISHTEWYHLVISWFITYLTMVKSTKTSIYPCQNCFMCLIKDYSHGWTRPKLQVQKKWHRVGPLWKVSTSSWIVLSLEKVGGPAAKHQWLIKQVMAHDFCDMLIIPNHPTVSSINKEAPYQKCQVCVLGSHYSWTCDIIDKILYM